LRRALDIDKRKCILCLTLLILVILIVLNLALIPKEEARYPDNSDITSYLHQFSTDFPTYTKIVSIGDSVESRRISSINIEDKDSPGPKQLVWVVCGMHAREWTSPLACIHIITNILQAMKQQKEDILKKFRYKIVPLANPDGYAFSQAGVRLFRKNKNSSGCENDEFDGVDLNRNFPVGFRSNTDVCSDTYPGKQPFSETETRALRDAFQADIPDVFLSIHGNAQQILTPYAYKYSDTAKTETLEVSGTNYPVGPAASVMYSVGGTMMDWVAEDLGVNRTFTLELRSLCDGSTDELTICHWQPDVTLARDMILPQALQILTGILSLEI